MADAGVDAFPRERQPALSPERHPHAWLYDQQARISIEPVGARFFDFGAGRMPFFLTKLAGDA